jgi:shikimate kinase
MNNSGVTIYLEVDIHTLVDRLMYAKQDRPLIWGKSREDLTVYAEDLLDKRQNDYQKAKHIINGKDLKIDTLVSLF